MQQKAATRQCCCGNSSSARAAETAAAAGCLDAFASTRARPHALLRFQATALFAYGMNFAKLMLCGAFEAVLCKLVTFCAGDAGRRRTQQAESAAAPTSRCKCAGPQRQRDTVVLW